MSFIIRKNNKEDIQFDTAEEFLDYVSKCHSNKWQDHVAWFFKSVFYYPIEKFFSDLKAEVKFSLQYLIRGYSDIELWSLDLTFIDYVLYCLRHDFYFLSNDVFDQIEKFESLKKDKSPTGIDELEENFKEKQQIIYDFLFFLQQYPFLSKKISAWMTYRLGLFYLQRIKWDSCRGYPARLDRHYKNDDEFGSRMWDRIIVKLINTFQLLNRVDTLNDYERIELKKGWNYFKNYYSDLWD